MYKNAATLKDVAREAGFSVMTVSNVLSGKKLNHASPRSREVILATAKRLNYRPNLNARQLVTRRSHRIGCWIDSQSPNFYRDVMHALDAQAFGHGYRLHVGFVHNDFESMRDHVADFRGSGIDSVICLAHAYPAFGERVPALVEEFGHAVFMEQPLAPTRFPVVATDHYRNFYDATAGLLARGYRRIFSLRSEYRDRAYTEALRGMRDAYREAGVRFEDNFWWNCETEWWRDFDTAARELDRILPERPEALILGNDEAMFWALRALAARGVSVPGDMALFSADLWHYGRAAQPSFSGFDYDAPRIARRIMDCLLGSFQDGGAATGVQAPLELVPARVLWGESCGGHAV